MKTKIFGGIAIVAIALAVAFNVSLNTGKTNNASLLALANVEALADTEEGGITCHQTCYHSPAICWGTEWNYSNWDAKCYRTGSMSDKCYAYKCD